MTGCPRGLFHPLLFTTRSHLSSLSLPPAVDLSRTFCKAHYVFSNKRDRKSWRGRDRFFAIFLSPSHPTCDLLASVNKKMKKEKLRYEQQLAAEVIRSIQTGNAKNVLTTNQARRGDFIDIGIQVLLHTPIKVSKCAGRLDP